MKIEFYRHNVGEENFADYLNLKYAVGLNSRTGALHLAILALGIEPGRPFEQGLEEAIEWYKK